MDSYPGSLNIAVSLFLFGAIISALPELKHKQYVFFFPAAGALLFAVSGIAYSLGHSPSSVRLPLSSFWDFSFRFDALAGFFVTVISALVFAVSVYSVGYFRNRPGQGQMGCLSCLFIVSLYAVVLSGNIVTFLIAWETMSIVSYFLVTFDREEKSAHAGLVYAVMTHIGTAFILAAFLILFSCTGHVSFTDIKTAAPSMPEWAKTTVFLFCLVGFGTKAGIVPLHTWLPKAHPAAPSNISALMSGVMIKTGIYGLIRIIMDVLGGGPEWWGITILIIGAVSSVLGVLYALMEHDLKRLLAYHSVENIGIILLGIGASISFLSSGLPALSALALTAGLYHTLNHALFKGLLFLSAGAVMHSTHTKNMEHLGGLIKTMPYTGFFFLVGSVSICALPPFNGFVSEWLTYQALILGFASPSVASKIISPLGGAALALTGALAAACFVKAFGISFLGLPRTSHAAEAEEVSLPMIAGMAVPALLCLLCGIAPGAVISLVLNPVGALTGARGIGQDMSSLFLGETAAGLSPAGILFSVVVVGAAAALFVRITGGKRKTVMGDSWDCGMPALSARMQYSATAFTKPIRLIFKRIYLPRRDIRISYSLKPLFVRSMQYSSRITPFFDRYLYDPLTSLIHALAGKVRILQSGSLHLYLGYMLAVLIILLIFGT